MLVDDKVEQIAGGMMYRDKLKNYVRRSGMSAKDLAKAWGVAPSTLYYWISGKRPVPGPIRFILDSGYAPNTADPDESRELHFLITHFIGAMKWCRIETIFGETEIQIRPWDRVKIHTVAGLIDALRELYHKSELETEE